mgnify:CR=1 FL=1
MSKYSDQGCKERNLGGVKAPAQGCNDKIIRQAGGETVGIVGMKGIGKDGLPLRPYPPKAGR